MSESKIGTGLLILIAVAAISLISSSVKAQELDVSVLKKSTSLGAGITEKQLKTVLGSKKVYCANINGKNYLASVGAMTIFNKVVTPRTKSVVCNDKVKRQALSEGIEVIQLGKSKMTAKAYAKLGKALIKAFGV